jgi:ribosome biogenesis GTPase / thiamine phosphate phosphatase
MFLDRIGADARVREYLRPFEAEGMELGRVSFAAHELYRVYLESGECEAVPAGRLRWDEELPAVGDWIAALRVDSELAWMEAVLPRRTQFSRQAAGTGITEQVLAANIDLALIVCGLDGDFNLRRLERYLVLAKESGAQAVVVLNKLDTCEGYAERVSEVEEVAPGTPVLAISAHETVEPLQALVRGRTVVLLGSSGVGKSTIVNGLLRDRNQLTAPVRASDSRGRHTTTSRMLLPLPEGGAILDTPGMRELQLWASEDSLDQVFPDVRMVAEQCKFGDCSHTKEPGCAVRQALDAGVLDASRWESYRKLQKEVRHHSKSQQDQIEEKKKWKAIHKAMRKHPKYNR